MPHYFFPATQSAARQITDLFDFAWPTAAALWNLRWQVAGFLKEVPQSTPKQLNDRFVFGSNIHGTNLKRACVDTTWEIQQQHLAGIMLTNAFAVYEHWADEILLSVGLPSDQGRLLQYGDSATRPGLQSTVRGVCQQESLALKEAYYPIFSQSNKYSWHLVENQLLCYRYFKELRNSQIHNGGKATERAVKAYEAFSLVSTKEKLGMKGALDHDAVVRGKLVSLHIRGVVGFCDILLRMMTSIDAELSRSSKAEIIFETLLRSKKLHSTLSSNPQRQHTQIIYCCKAAGLPKPAKTDALRDFIVQRRIIST